MIDEIELIKFLTKNYKDINLEQGFELWLKNVAVTNKEATYGYYVKILKNLLYFFGMYDIHSFQKITTESILNLTAWGKAKGWCNNTINKYLTAIKTVINYLVEIDIITKPSFKVNKLQEIIPEIEVVDMKDIKKIINYLNTQHNLQLSLVFYLILTTGVRRTELINIEINNINLKENSIFLSRTKNGKPRYIFIDHKIKDLVEKNMSLYPNQKFLFKRINKNEQATTSTIDFYFMKIKRDLGIKVLSPHKLRHSFATFLILNGADLNSTRLLLGHSSFEMTKRYIDFNKEQLKKINAKCNPLNNF